MKRTRSYALLCVAALLCAACDPESDTPQVTPTAPNTVDTSAPDASPSDAGTGPDEDAGPRNDPDGPTFLGVQTDPLVASPDDTVTVTATFLETEPLQVVLLAADADHTYGTLSRSTPGSYSITLNWAQLHAFDAPDTRTRLLRARATNTNGATSTFDRVIGLECADGAETLCSGSCVDTDTDPNHCGACGYDAYAGQYDCVDGSYECEGGVRCDDVCVASPGFSSDPRRCGDCDTDCFAPLVDADGIITDTDCLGGKCIYSATTLRGMRSCEEICREVGLSCQEAGNGGFLNCGQDTPSDGCARYDINERGCRVSVPLECDEAPSMPTADVLEAECNTRDLSALELVTTRCRCEPARPPR